jgi:AhpD family alkylhydroperoxidase
MMAYDARQPRIAYPGPEQQDSRVRAFLRHEEQVGGRARNLTRLAAMSPVAWRATNHALSLYDGVRRLDPAAVHLLCLSVALLNGCEYCIDDSAGEALRAGVAPALLAKVGTAQECELVDTPGRPLAPALEFSRQVSGDPSCVTDTQFDRLRVLYGEESLLEIVLVVTMKNFWTRFATVLRLPREGKCPDPLFGELTTLSDCLRRRSRVRGES